MHLSGISHIQSVFVDFVALSKLGSSFTLVFFFFFGCPLLPYIVLYMSFDLIFFPLTSNSTILAKVLQQRHPIIISKFVTIPKKKEKKVTYLVLSYASTFMSQLICMYNRIDLCYVYTKRIIYP